MRTILRLHVAIGLALQVPLALASDTDIWASHPSRNMVLQVGKLPERLDDSTLLWRQNFRAGAHYAMPTVIGDQVICGYRGDGLQDPVLQKQASRKCGALVCRDLHDGSIVWELAIGGNNVDNRFGVVQPPVVDGDRLYLLGLYQVLCLDLAGQADGDQGIDDTAWYQKYGIKVDSLPAHYGDVLWSYDTDRELKVHPEDASSCAVLLQDDFVWVATGHSKGMKDEEYNPAPSLIVLERETGRLVAQDGMEIPFIFHGQWSSPSMGVVDGQVQVYFADGYGWLHAFAPPEVGQEGVQELQEIWRCDLNAPHRYQDGKEIPYHEKHFKPTIPIDDPYWATFEDGAFGPSEAIATPVFHEGLIYIGPGRDAAHSGGGGAGGLRNEGTANFLCIDPRGSGDITDSNIVWHNTEAVVRTQSTASILDDMIFVADTNGFLNCLDLATGEELWEHDLGAKVTCRSQLVADGKVYVSTDKKKNAFVLRAAREKELLWEGKAEGESATPGVGGGVVLLTDQKGISAFAGPGH